MARLVSSISLYSNKFRREIQNSTHSRREIDSIRITQDTRYMSSAPTTEPSYILSVFLREKAKKDWKTEKRKTKSKIWKMSEMKEIMK